MSSFTFRGTIVDAAGEPLANHQVTVYRKTTLRDYDARQPSATTNPAGGYTVEFTWDDIETGDFELAVADGLGSEVGRSVILLKLGEGEHLVDLVAGGLSYRGRSEFRRIEVAVAPLASDGGAVIPYEDLALADVDYLANTAQHSASVIATFIHAHRLTLLTERAVPADALFGMLREGLSPELPELLAQGPEVQRAALERAITRNRFDDPGASALDVYIRTLDSLAIDAAVWVDLVTGDKSKFRQMIDAAGREQAEGIEAKQRAFLAKYTAHEGELDNFWEAVLADAELGQEVHDTYKWCLQIQAVCNGHQPLIDALQARRNDGQDPLERFADLATIDVSGWQAMIDGGVGVPDSIPLEWDQSTRARRYAETIARLVSDAVPTRVVHQRIKRDAVELAGAGDLDTFFSQNPAFELRQDVLGRYLAATPGAFGGVPDTGGRRETCEDNVRTLQRLSYVAPRGSTYDTIKALYPAGVRSARDIDAMGPVAFERRFAPELGEGELGKTRARAVYDRASQVYGMTVSLLTKFAPAFTKVGLRTAYDGPGLPEGAPELEALFGAMDFCSCERCRSVFSPAAYMVDLLQFLRQQPGIGSDDALAVLQARRPDLTKIDLSCANATTPLPYVDLVNELLETRVSNDPAPGDEHWQTTWSAEELALRPERRDEGAYTQLVAAAYPWQLPFDLHRSEADLYLEGLGVSRHELLEVLAPNPDIDALTRARLGLSKAAFDALSGAQGFSTLDAWDGKDALALGSVASVLETSGHSFDELKVLVRTSFVGTWLSLVFEDFPDDCDLAQASVGGLSDAHLERWHRFVRLQRALGWTVYELDAALRALAPTPTQLDAACLQHLGAAKMIGGRLGIEGLALFELWAAIDIETPPEDAQAASRYASAFLQRTLVDDPQSSAFALDPSGELSTTALAMSDDSRLPVVLAGLGVTRAEVGELVDWLTSAGMPADTTTTRAILSAARRRVTLARALSLTLAELRRLVALTGLDPCHDDATSVVDIGGLQRTLDFLDAAQAVRESAFSGEALDYILHHETPNTPGIVPNKAASLALLGRLDALLAAVGEHHTLAEDPTSAQLRDALATYLPSSEPADPGQDAQRLDEAMAVILGTSAKSTPEQDLFIATHFGPFLADVAATQAALVAGGLAQTSPRIAHVLAQLLPWLEARQRRATTLQTLSEGLGLSVEVGELLLVNTMQGPEEVALVELFEAGANLDQEGEPAAASAEGFVRLYKAGALVLGHRFDARDLAYLYGPSAPVPAPWLHVNALSASTAGSASFTSWSRLHDVARARARSPEHDDTLEALRDMGELAELGELLAARGPWRAEDVTELAAALGHADVAAFDDEAAYLAILDALELVERTGMNASQLTAMTINEATAAEADALRLSLRARVGEAAWASTGKASRDRLREQQRRALVAYLLASGDAGESFADENDLYAHYLLDVEMSPCATSSRIKLALSSLQLFIQRVFLNLEAPMQLDADAATQYRWMKNYRVWEANRKVFLYPENFVAPELRHDKSPLFAELEAALSQDAPSEQLTERAFLGYLQGLERIAKPEVMGLVRERVGEVDRLHVVARTRGEPHQWLYRTREDDRYWTPWVALDANIDGEHVLPAVFNGRLYILWPSFALVGEEISQVDPASEGSSGAGHVELRLNWMERRFGEWSPVRMSPALKTPTSIQRWELPSFRKKIRLSTRTVQSQSSGRCALEVAVRNSFSYLQQDHDMAVNLFGIGRFVLEASDDSFVAQTVPPDGVVSNWTVEFNDHLLAGQFVVSTSSAPSELELETQESRWPYRSQTQVLFAAPPRGYSLLFAQSDRPGLVRSTGFFYQDRWRSLFIEPRDIHRASLRTAADADPADIEAAPFLEQAGLKAAPPVVDLEPHVIEIAPKLLSKDGLAVKTPTYVGLAGVVASKAIAVNAFAQQQIQALAEQEQEQASKIHGAKASKRAPRSSLPWKGKRFRAQVFEHPYTDVFVGEVRAGGVDGLLAPSSGQGLPGLARQQLTQAVLSEESYDAKGFDHPLPAANVDFSVGGAYSVYNWELFFHAPVLLAKRLTSSQRFEEADRWLRKVFDPTASDGAAPARYWKIKPFFEAAQVPDIHELLLLLQYDGPQAEKLAAREAFEDQIWRWRRRPFDPHLIASLREGSYQRAVVMQYLDNLVAWGDSLFAQDSIEAINEATQLYIMAQNILGPRPVMVDPHGEPEPKNFEELEGVGLDAFSNALVELENYTQGSFAYDGMLQQDLAPKGFDAASVPHTWYFCVPPNDELLGYWDTVDDRLTKIRSCQNLQGIERKLALFQPPLDPAALLAAAGGGDFASALAAASGRAPRHRFRVLLGKALELAGEVRGLGSTLLRALESRDAAKLAQLRAGHEPKLLEHVRATLELRLESSERAAETLDAAKATVWNRRSHFKQLIHGARPIVGRGDNVARSEAEQMELYLLEQALGETSKALTWSQVQRVMSLLPNLQLGIQGAGASPVLTMTFGGSQLASVMGAHASIHQQRSSIHSLEARSSGLNASFDRRLEEWTFQADNATNELEHIEAQRVAALAQIEVAKAELSAHDKRVEQAEAVDAFMRSRYTNELLYAWMQERIKQIYKQAYDLSHRMALAAEQAYRFELQRDDSFIGYAYWDQAHAGLLAGELLVHDLRRMDAAYLDHDEREYELSKVLSLAQIDPYALATLRQSGACYFSVPEWVYDLDHPGHVRRRIKSVSVAMPAVAGPHVGGGYTLTLESSKIRAKTGGDYPESAEDPRFVYRYGQVERIATSSGRDSTGLFEPSLEGPRYLPFEGAGALSTWRVALPEDLRQFDYESIGDVLLTIRYTAREGGQAQAQAALASLASVNAAQAYLSQPGATGSAMLLRASVDFADAWHAFLRQEHGEATRRFTMTLDAARFPHVFAQRSNLEITALRMVLVTRAPTSMQASVLVPSGGDPLAAAFTPNEAQLGGQMLASWDGVEAPGSFSLEVAEGDLDELGVAYGDGHARFNEAKVRELVAVVFFRDPS